MTNDDSVDGMWDMVLFWCLSVCLSVYLSLCLYPLVGRWLLVCGHRGKARTALLSGAGLTDPLSVCLSVYHRSSIAHRSSIIDPPPRSSTDHRSTDHPSIFDHRPSAIHRSSIHRSSIYLGSSIINHRSSTDHRSWVILTSLIHRSSIHRSIFDHQPSIIDHPPTIDPPIIQHYRKLNDHLSSIIIH